MSEIQGEDLYIAEIQTPNEEEIPDSQSTFENATRFLDNLPPVFLSELPDNQRLCGICIEPYGTDAHDTRIARLPCGHCFGFGCIYEWLKPANSSQKNTCPMCRMVLFEVGLQFDTDSEDEDDDDRLIPGLDVLLAENTFGSFCEALSLVEPIIRGRHPMPRGFGYYYSVQMLAFYGAFMDGPTAHPDDELSEPVFMDLAKTKIAECLGQLYIRFGTLMADRGLPIPWRENGPRLEILFDQEMRDMVELGIMSFARNEALFGHELGRRVHSE